MKRGGEIVVRGCGEEAQEEAKREWSRVEQEEEEAPEKRRRTA